MTKHIHIAKENISKGQAVYIDEDGLVRAYGETDPSEYIQRHFDILRANGMLKEVDDD
jgi:hypothetical protein